MQPAFSPDVYDYTASIANSAGFPFSSGGIDLLHVIRMDPRVNDFRDGGATFDAILTQPGRSPTGYQNDVREGPFNLILTPGGTAITTGTAVIALLVTAESGATQTYTITMYIREPVPAAPVSQVQPSDWDLKPAAVAAGQPFRLMFLNTGGVTGRRSNNITDYNNNSQGSGNGAAGGHAAIRGFAGQFRALISTTAVDARDNTATTGTGVPIYWLNGDKVADNYADFYDGSWESRSPQNRFGLVASDGSNVLTSTNADGSGDLLFLPGGGRSAFRVGRLDQGEGAEIHSASTVNHEVFSAQYALSPVLTVAESGDAGALSDLQISAGELSPAFAPATLNYSVDVSTSATTFTVTPTLATPGTDRYAVLDATHGGASTLDSTILVNSGDTSDPIPLNIGANTITLSVVAGTVTVQTYTLVVTRLSDDATLSMLEVVPPSGAASVAVQLGNPTEYHISVANTANHITLRPTTTHPDATFLVNGTPPAPVPLRVGANTIQFSVIAANGVSLQTYTLTVTRRDPIPAAPVVNVLPSGSAFLPPGFEDGRPFRLMFVSLGNSATAVEISSYNQIANSNAAGGAGDIRPFADQFRALVSTAQVDARDNTATTGTGVPIYWLGGDRVADDYADFYDGEWGNHLPRNRQGNRYSATNIVWTGSNADGTGIIPYQAGEGGGVQFGRVTIPGEEISSSQASAGSRGLYIISPLLKVAPTLTTLEIGPASANNALIPAFDPEIFNYRVAVRQGTTITVRAIDSTDFSVITVNGFELPFNSRTSDPIDVPDSGETIISVVLTDPADTLVATTYTLTATRQPSDSPNLLDLTISPGTLVPAFNPAAANNSFLVNVPYEATELTITPFTPHVNNHIDITGGTPGTAAPAGSYRRALAVGSNTITITVTSSTDGITRTYTLNTTRRDQTPTPPERVFLSPGSSLIPSQLGVGDVFRLLFMTETRNAEANAIADYNSHVQANAAASTSQIDSFSSRFRALTSTKRLEARDNTATNRVTDTHPDASIYWLGGAKVADDYADFYDGNWDSNDGRDRNGNTLTTFQAWTGSRADGTSFVAHQLGSERVRYGTASVATREISHANSPRNGNRRLYALSPLLSAATPSTLSALRLTRADGSEVALSPAFHGSITTYHASVANTESSITVTATPADADASVARTRVISLVSGGFVGIFTRVTGTDGSTTDYIVNVTRRESPPSAPLAQSLPQNSSLVSSDLEVGDQFRLLFVNTGKRNGTNPAIGSYNGSVQSGAAAGHADIRAFSSQFRALLSTTTLDARENTATIGTGVPIYWLGGARVANDYADFYDGEWASRTPRNHDGATLGPAGRTILTGSNADGSGDSPFQVGSSTIRIGRLDQGPGAEIRSAETSLSSAARELYVMSPLITLAGPNTTLSFLNIYDNATGENIVTGPSFNSETTEYAVSVPNDTIEITLEPTLRYANAAATIDAIHTGTGATTLATVPIASEATSAPIPLGEGVTRIRIAVTSTRGPIHTTLYTLNVTRLGAPPPAPLPRNLLIGSPFVPPGLRVGQQFRLLFVGSGSTPTESDISHYNNIVVDDAINGVAGLSPFASQFRALVSNATLDARDNTGTRSGSGDVPIYWLGGDKVADNYADFYDNSWDSRNARDHFGNPLTLAGLTILTGSLENGIGQSTTRIGDDDNGVRIGRLDGVNAGGEIDSGTVSGSGSHRLYGLSPLFTLIAVTPQPPVVLNPIPDQMASVREPFGYTFPANTFYDLNEDVLTYSASGLPGWLSFDAAARSLSGTPPSSAFEQPLVTITITASDGDSATAVSDDFTLTINAGPPAAVTNIRGVAVNAGINLSWDAVTETGGYPVVRYTVQISRPDVIDPNQLLTYTEGPYDTTSIELRDLQNTILHTIDSVTVLVGPSADDLRLSTTTTLGQSLLLTPSDATLDPEAFITTWIITVRNQTITIPTNDALTYAYTVNWGDGNSDTTTYTGDASHRYTLQTTYTVSITGVFPQIYFNGGGDRTSIRSIRRWGPQVWQSMAGSFAGCTNLFIAGDAGVPVLSEVTSMRSMFQNADNFNSPIGQWDVSNVTNIAQMFQNADAFNQQLNEWDVTAVTDMSRMFNGASAFNQPLGEWEVGGAPIMTAMFNNAAAFNQDLSAWDVSGVTGMAEMFNNAAAFDQNLGAWDVGNVATMTNMLNGVTLSTANYDALLNGWSEITGDETALTENVSFHAGSSQFCAAFARNELTAANSWTILDGGRDANCPLVAGAFVTTWRVTAGQTLTIPTNSALTYDYNYNVDWGDGAVSTAQSGNAMNTYTDAGDYTIAITGDFPQLAGGSNAAIRRVVQWGDQVWGSMQNSFAGATNFGIAPTAGQPILSPGTSMESMFQGATGTNSPIGHWDVSNVTNMAHMFQNASSFNQDLSAWDVSGVTDLNRMFNGATAFDQNLGTWDVRKVTDLTDMFNGVKLSTEKYDNLLAGWGRFNMEEDAENRLMERRTFGAGNSQYCNQRARDLLTGAPTNWDISDSGPDQTAGLCTPQFASGVSIAPQNYTIGADVTLELPAAFGGAAPLTYSLSALPGGLAFDQSTRLLTGVTSVVMPATSVTYTVTDANGETAVLLFTISVVRLVFDTAENRTFTAGTEVTYLLPPVTSGVEPVRYTLNGDFPPGLHFDSGMRQIRGTPTEVTAATVLTYTATDANLAVRTQTFTVAVAAGLTLDAIDNQFYTQLQIIDVTLPQAVGGAAPLTYTLIRTSGSSNLVNGLDFYPVDRAIRGIAGPIFGTLTHNVVNQRYTVTDTNGVSVSRDFTMEFFRALRIRDDGLGISHQTYTAGVSIPPLIFNNSIGGFHPTVALTPAPPPGLTFDLTIIPPSRAFHFSRGVYGTLSGTPIMPLATAIYTYTASEDNDQSVFLTFSITVNPKPAFDTTTIDAPNESYAYIRNHDITPLILPPASGAEPLSYTLTPDPPAGLSFDPSARTLTGRPTGVTASPAMLVYTATDGNPQVPASVALTFSVTVFSAGITWSGGDFVETAANHGAVSGQLVATLVGDTFAANPLDGAMLPEGNVFVATTGLDSQGNSLGFTAVVTRTNSGVVSMRLTGRANQHSNADDYVSAATGTNHIGLLFADAAFTNSSAAQVGNVGFTEGMVDFRDPDPLEFVVAAIDAQSYPANAAIPILTLPTATGGLAPLSYALRPATSIPDGLTFDVADRTLRGTPTGAVAVDLLYTVTDADMVSADLVLNVTITEDNVVASGSPLIDFTGDLGPLVTLSVDLSPVTDDNGLPADAAYTYQWQQGPDSGADSGYDDLPDATGSEFTLDATHANRRIRVMVSFTDNAGYPEVVFSVATQAVPALVTTNTVATTNSSFVLSATPQAWRDAERAEHRRHH